MIFSIVVTIELYINQYNFNLSILYMHGSQTFSMLKKATCTSHTWITIQMGIFSSYLTIANSTNKTLHPKKQHYVCSIVNLKKIDFEDFFNNSFYKNWEKKITFFK